MIGEASGADQGESRDAFVGGRLAGGRQWQSEWLYAVELTAAWREGCRLGS